MTTTETLKEFELEAAQPDIAALRVALIGYGEVGGIFGAALPRAGVRAVTAFDILIANASWAEEARTRASRDSVALASSTREAIANSDLIISAVTAASTASATEQIASGVRRGAFVLDVNSASPRTKTACAEVIRCAGGRYVEAAVMSSVPPHGIRAPMLLGGPHATSLRSTLAKLGFAATVGSESYGVVSAIKLCRSVIVKGMEALAIESLLSARRYGVEREVLASLAETFPGLDWERQATWFWLRVVQHGRRRAEEMREAAVTVGDAGIASRMTTATADVQAWIAMLRAEGVFASAGADATWRDLADLVDREMDDQTSVIDGSSARRRDR
jgi:3-hydroxyisobutyrate dehydrogenase-like beta-hydroxyacid dehydrogenase